MNDVSYLASEHDPWIVLASVAVAILASYVTLDLSLKVRKPEGGVSKMWWLAGSLVMGTAIWSMHFVGMLAFSLPIQLGFSHLLTFASWLAAVAASVVALGVASAGRYGLGSVAGASVAMGAAICGMHYTGMAAASFPFGSICLSAQELGGRSLAAIVAIATLMLLLGTLLASILEVRLQRVARQLSQSLQESNERLQSANDELLQRALSDPLTGLPNRLLFEDRLRQAVQRCGRSHQNAVVEQLAVLFVDLDGFKPVNDTFGHGAGDQILIASAQRLVAEARSGDTVARVGGDEFVLLLEGLRDVEDCVAVANRILRAFAQPFEVAGRQLRISCSIGIAMHAVQGDAEKLVAHADAAMYAAKRTGGSSLAFFEAHMAIDAADHLQLQSDLRQALEDNQLELYYQPKIHGRRHRMSGLEALVRWNHPRLGVVGPDTFIPLAERFGLIVRLGHWVINEACRQVAAWGSEGRHMRVAVNLSVHQLREVSLVDSVEEALRRHGLLGSQLICEITESVAIQEREITTRIFEGLARIGRA